MKLDRQQTRLMRKWSGEELSVARSRLFVVPSFPDDSPARFALTVNQLRFSVLLFVRKEVALQVVQRGLLRTQTPASNKGGSLP